jgi:hypothetical protein
MYRGPRLPDLYGLSFPKDRKLLKLAVGWVYVVGIAQTTLALMDFYNLTSILLIEQQPCSTSPEDRLWFTVQLSSTVGTAFSVIGVFEHRNQRTYG